MRKLLTILFLFVGFSLVGQQTFKRQELIADTSRLKNLSAAPDSMLGYGTVFAKGDSLWFMDQNEVTYNLLDWLDSLMVHNTHLYNIEDSLRSHTDTLEVHRTELNAHMDSISAHRTLLDAHTDSIADHRTAIDALIGTSNILQNDTWFYVYNYVGTLVGGWKVSKDNTLIAALPVEISSFRLLPDSRYTIANVPIVSAPYGDTVSIGLGIDDRRILQLSLVSDGAGTGTMPTAQITGVLRVLDSIVGTYGRFTAQVQADSVNAVSKYLFNGVDIRVTGTLDTIAYKDQDNNFTVGQTVTDLYASDSITANSIDVADTLTTAYLKIPTGASNGYVWKSDANGLGSWQQITNAYKGTWNANTNTPTLADGVGTAGDFYIVSVGDTIDLGSGNVIFLTGGTAIYSGTIWEAINPYAAVTSVNSLIGDVQLNLTLDADTLSLTGGGDIDISSASSIVLLEDTSATHNTRLIAIENDTTHFKVAWDSVAIFHQRLDWHTDSLLMLQDSITKHKGWYYTLQDSVTTNIGDISKLNDSITKHKGWYYSLQDSVVNNMDSITKHKGWYYSLRDSVINEMDSTTKHSGWYYSLRDSVVNEMDSTVKHTGWYYSLRDSVVSEMDSTTKHTGWYYTLRDSVINLDDSLAYYSLVSEQDSITNDTWYKSANYAGASLNAWKISKDNNLVPGVKVEVNELFKQPDTWSTLVNVPAVAAAYGDTVGIKLTVDDEAILKLYGISDGAGSVTGKTVSITGTLKPDSILGFAKLTDVEGLRDTTNLRIDSTKLRLTDIEDDTTNWNTAFTNYANKSLSNLTTTSINQSLIPTNSTLSLGSATYMWLDLFLYGAKSTRLVGNAASTDKIIGFPNLTGTVLLQESPAGDFPALPYLAEADLSGVRDTLDLHSDSLSLLADSLAYFFLKADTSLLASKDTLSFYYLKTQTDSIASKVMDTVNLNKDSLDYLIQDSLPLFARLAGADFTGKVTVTDSLIATTGYITGKLGVGAKPGSWNFYSTGQNKMDSILYVFSKETGKENNRIVINPSDGDLLRIQATDISGNLPLYLGGAADATGGLKIDADASIANLTSSGLKLGTINHATTDLDKFMADSAGFLKYRTGAELFGDIGLTDTLGLFARLTGATFSGKVTVDDTLRIGTYKTIYEEGASLKFRDSRGYTLADINTSGAIFYYQNSRRMYITDESIIFDKHIVVSDYQLLEEQSVKPDTPPSGYGSFFPKDDGKLYYENSSGTVYDLTASGGGGGSVTSITAGNGMNFTTITTTGTVTLGTPSTVDASTANGFPSATTHTHALGIISYAKGGTGLSEIAAGSVLVANAANTYSALTSTSGTYYLKNVDGTMSWAAGTGMTNPMTTAGDIIIGGASGTPARLGIGTEGYVLKSVSGAPAWAAATATAGGSSTEVQYNNGGSLDGIPFLKVDEANNKVTVSEGYFTYFGATNYIQGYDSPTYGLYLAGYNTILFSGDGSGLSGTISALYESGHHRAVLFYDDVSALQTTSTGITVTGATNSTTGFKYNGNAGVTSSFTTADGKVATVSGGIITALTTPAPAPVPRVEQPEQTGISTTERMVEYSADFRQIRLVTKTYEDGLLIEKITGQWKKLNWIQRMLIEEL